MLQHRLLLLNRANGNAAYYWEYEVRLFKISLMWYYTPWLNDCDHAKGFG